MPMQTRAQKRARLVADDIVTATSLATHLGCTRQAIIWATGEGILERRSDGHYDQSLNRLRYIKHLREKRRQSARSVADTEVSKKRALLLDMDIQKRLGELIPKEKHIEEIHGLCGIVLTALSSWPAMIGGRDLMLRRQAEALLRDLRWQMTMLTLELGIELDPEAEKAIVERIEKLRGKADERFHTKEEIKAAVAAVEGK
jgi:hypothetical protein